MGTKKGNQKGFTLLELLVTVAILAIIAIPLLNAFLISVRTDAKAKTQMRATTAATNVMEEIKASSWDHLITDRGCVPDENGVYAFSEEQVVDNKLFTVEVSATPDAGGATEYNQVELAQLQSIGENDGIYVQNTHQNENYAKKLKDVQTTDASLYTGVKFATEVTIEHVGTSTKVSVESSYSYKDKTEQTVRETIFENTDDVCNLKNIYLFYYPIAGSNANTILVDNTDLVPVNVYLVSQNLDTTASLDFRVQLRCLEPERDDYMTNCKTRVCSNIPATRNGKGLMLTYLQGERSDVFLDKDWSDSVSRFDAKTILDFHDDLANAQKQNWVYEVTVSAHEGRKGENDYDKTLATFTSTIEK